MGSKRCCRRDRRDRPDWSDRWRLRAVLIPPCVLIWPVPRRPLDDPADPPDWIEGSGGIRHLPPELLFELENPFFVNPERCFAAVEELRARCAAGLEDPFFCSEEALEAFLIGCLTPFR